MPSRFRPLRTSARVTLVAAGAAVALGVIAGASLDGGAATLALTALGGFVACALYAILSMSRYALAAVAAASSALAIGCALAFLRLLGLAWDQDPDAVTTVSSRDADPFFFGAIAATAVTLILLLAGAAWPQAHRPSKRRRPAAGAAARRPVRAPSSTPRKRAPSVQATVRRAPAAGRARVSASSSRGARRN